MINVAVVGGTGYTGVELLRILANHSEVAIRVVTSRSDQGQPVSALYPNLRGVVDLAFTQPSVEALAECDLVFFATPNGTAMRMAEALLERDTKVIDLAADFRLKDVAVWEKWYGEPHYCPELLQEAVYGLPEVNRAQLAEARLVASAGCYPTAVQLGFLPLVNAGVIDITQLIADVKSGVSGAGRKAQVSTLMSECGESFKAYSATGHRHLPEIIQGLELQARGSKVGLTFVPHLLPMIRGIHATLYAPLKGAGEITDDELQALYQRHYENELFVDLLPFGSHPDTRNVRGANRCQIALHRPQGGKMVVVLSVIDNLVKGAAGQAVQSMNLMYGLEESAGLNQVGLYP